MNDIYSDTQSLKKSLRKRFPAASSNQLTIKAAKQIAKENKIKVNQILRLFSPSENIQNDISWDKEGNIK